MENGTPCSGPRSSPLITACSASRAAASATSGVTVQKALTIGLRRSIRSSTRRVSSTGESFRARISVASSVAGVKARSDDVIVVSGLLLRDQPVPERQMRQPRALEGVHGIFGRADEWLAVEIVRRVVYGADSCRPIALAHDALVRRVLHRVLEPGADRSI